MKLHTLTKITDKKMKIIGRGYGSGKGGHTVGRGSKGQKARSNSRLKPFFEGGQNPLSMRVPQKKGFDKHTKIDNEIIKLESLNIFEDNSQVDASDLFKAGLIIGKGDPKILDHGEIKKKLNIVGIKCSKSAQEKIEKQGGSVK